MSRLENEELPGDEIEQLYPTITARIEGSDCISGVKTSSGNVSLTQVRTQFKITVAFK